MVNVGIVGLGPEWEVSYRPALLSLRDRIRVSCIYDPVFNRAQQAADQANAIAAESIVALRERPDIRAFLLLDVGWHRWEALKLLCAARKPTYVETASPGDVDALRLIHQSAANVGLPLVPALRYRYMPATVRLRELMATRLGSPKEIRIEATIEPVHGGDSEADAGRRDLIGMLDWCRYFFQATPDRLQATSLNGAAHASLKNCEIVVHFTEKASDGSGSQARLLVSPAETSNAASLRCIAHCRKGTAVITGPSSIEWTLGSDRIQESLAGERSEFELMLDLFCRRVVGGLVPVADLSDLLRSVDLLQAARQSLQSGEAVACRSL